jgi:ABC-2 type transport system ATP-binding protein
MEPVIDTLALRKAYPGVVALKGLTLQVPEHSIFGFLGPNGAGKTTTIKLLLGLIRPTSGTARIFGLDSVQDSVAIRSRVGYLPQDPRFYEEMTSRQILNYTTHFFFSGPQEEIDRRIGETLALVGLDDRADRPIKGFSGGERQRLGIAQAQVHYPDLLILDEPAASLDPMGRRDVLEVMARLRKHTTIFYCTHILDDVQRVSDTVAILNRGELVAFGAIEALLAGSGEVAYEVKLRGATPGAESRVAAQPWVAALQSREQNGVTTWTVAVSDAERAEREFFRLLAAEPEIIVTSYQIKARQLEEVFLQLVEGGDDGNL